MTLDSILEQIKNSEKIVILTHESPDGDAVGSSLALKLMVEKLGKSADVLMTEYSRFFEFLPSADEIKEDSDIKNYDLAISVDCSDLKRLDRNEYFENAKTTINIDHHGSNTMYGELNYVNPVSPACCEILAGMCEYFEIDISKEIGSCLMTGIITDTGGFRHKGVNADTFEFVANLIRAGVDVTDIYKKTLKTNTKANYELTKRVMDRMEFLENGRVTFTYITLDDEKEVNAEPGDHEGLVNIGIDVENVEVSIFIRQKEDDNEAYKVSMRSLNDINVSDICLMFGGGGHPRAAGALVQGTLEQVKAKVLKEVKNALK